MCGIVGITGRKKITTRLVEALEKLEYRGYDSAGVATIDENALHRVRASGKLVNLKDKLKASPLEGAVGIAHTRWATHGGPVEKNAHPHSTDQVAVVHNGIIENHDGLRAELKDKGVVFTSDTDTEVVVHLLDEQIAAGKAPLAALQAILPRLEGAYALGMIFLSEPESLYAARHGSPLALGISKGEMSIGSDAVALSLFTNRVIYLEEGDYAKLTPDSFEIYNRENNEVVRPETLSAIAADSISKDGYRHFMEKEIFEQPDAIAKTLESLKHPTLAKYALPDLGVPIEDIRRIVIIACGTSYYSGAVGRYWLEEFSGLPVDIDIASEFRYRTPRLEKGTLAIFISQSGETADTLAALQMVKSQGHHSLAIVNVATSSMAREADAVLHTQAGIEIGVASTKAFTTQLAVIAMLAVMLGESRKVLSSDQTTALIEKLNQVSTLLRHVLSENQPQHPAYHHLMHARDVLYIGRGTSYPLAMEGALKLKEISYIHAEGYAAGEMKHGPIALIDENVPVIVIAPKDRWQDKTLSNMQEARARGGKIVLVSDKATLEANKDYLDYSIEMPECDEFISAFIYSIPVQTLAYYTALLKGTDIDQPRNLAKSVTVE